MKKMILLLPIIGIVCVVTEEWLFANQRSKLLNLEFMEIILQVMYILIVIPLTKGAGSMIKILILIIINMFLSAGDFGSTFKLDENYSHSLLHHIFEVARLVIYITLLILGISNTRKLVQGKN